MQHNGKKGNRSGKKEDDPKSEDKGSNTADIAGAQVEDTRPHEESTAPIGGASIGVHVSEANEQLFFSSSSVEEILGAHSIGDDEFWVGLTQVTCLLTQQTVKKS